jgi:hypothetical protein
MGIYTEHWARHKKNELHGTLYAALVLAVGLPAVAFAGYLLEPLTGLRMAVLLVLITLWLVAFTAVLLRYRRVKCPQCDATYSRGRSVVNCPKCGLRMFQEQP